MMLSSKIILTNKQLIPGELFLVSAYGSINIINNSCSSSSNSSSKKQACKKHVRHNSLACPLRSCLHPIRFTHTPVYLCLQTIVCVYTPCDHAWDVVNFHGSALKREHASHSLNLGQGAQNPRFCLCCLPYLCSITCK